MKPNRKKRYVFGSMNPSIAWLAFHLEQVVSHRGIQRTNKLLLPSIVSNVLVSSLTANDDKPLPSCEPVGMIRRVRYDDEQEDGPQGAKCTNDNELPFPGRQVCWRF